MLAQKSKGMSSLATDLTVTIIPASFLVQSSEKLIFSAVRFIIDCELTCQKWTI